MPACSGAAFSGPLHRSPLAFAGPSATPLGGGYDPGALPPSGWPVAPPPQPSQTAGPFRAVPTNGGSALQHGALRTTTTSPQLSLLQGVTPRFSTVDPHFPAVHHFPSVQYSQSCETGSRTTSSLQFETGASFGGGGPYNMLSNPPSNVMYHVQRSNLPPSNVMYRSEDLPRESSWQSNGGISPQRMQSRKRVLLGYGRGHRCWGVCLDFGRLGENESRNF